MAQWRQARVEEMSLPPCARTTVVVGAYMMRGRERVRNRGDNRQWWWRGGATHEDLASNDGGNGSGDGGDENFVRLVLSH